MRKYLFTLFVCVASILALTASSPAQCPEDTVDHGNCDTLTVTCLDCEQTPGTGPWQVRFPLLITHDQTETIDSIAGFVIPLGWTRTNPAKYCSLDAYWNTTSTLYLYPDFARSIFRHIMNDTPPPDTLMPNRMAQLAGDFSDRDWDTRIVDVSTDGAYARMSIVATGTQDQRWWESDRELLATLTYVIEDTMTICMDSAFWPPTNELLWSRADGVTYVPRTNLPNCFTVGPPPAADFTIDAAPDTQTVEAGLSTDYTVTLTSVGGFSEQCTLAVAGLPAGAAATFAPSPVTPTNTSNMNVTTIGATPEGDYTLTITATELVPAFSPLSMGGDNAMGPVQIEHSTQVVLKVVSAEAIAVTAPNGGEEWCVGSSQNITWTSSGLDAVKIEYSTNSGSSWITEAATTPAAAGTYSWTIPDAPSQQCLVRICDVDDGTPCDQSDAVFTIKAAPTAPSGCIASDDLCDKVQFSWTDNSGNETGFYIYRDAAKFDSVGAGVTTYDDATATPGQTYSYGVSAYNDCGESSQCNDNGTREAPPANPSGCLASDDLCDKVQFTWTDNSDNESGFIIYRAGSALDTVGVDVTSYDDLTATPGQTYSYGVSAYNDCGESSQCNDNGTRQAPPDAPSDCVASDDLCDKVQFTWTDNSGDETGFYIYRDAAKLDSVGAGVTTYDDATATPGQTYSYGVSAYNDCGESSQCTDDGTRIAAPAAPSACAATDDLCDKVQFTWTDNSGDETGFYIYRDAAKLDSVGADVTSYDDLPATPGQTYTYGVSAYNDCGESSQCTDDGIRQAPPAAPSDCVASDDLCDKVQFTWTDNSGDETGFYIYRDAAKLDSVGVDVTSYDDLTATPGQTYSYGVSAYKDCGESSQCTDDGTREAPPANPSGCLASDDLCDKVSFSWTDNSGNETGFYIYRDAAKLDSVGAGVTTYDDLTATPGQTYSYGVSAYNDCGESSQCTDDGTRQAPPDAPSDCVASDDLCDKVQFTWTDNSGNETGFYIYRDAAKLDSVGAGVTTYDDLAATPGQTYSYGVSAYNDCGESSQCTDDGIRQAPPAAPSDCVASDDLCDRVTFSWTDNSGDETGFYIYRDAAKLDSVGADVTSYDDLTASPGATYSYCVSAYKDCGESSQCCDNGTRKAAPDAPSDCVASDDLCDRVNFCWTDNSGDETGFYIYRDAAKLDSVGVDATCYFDFTAVPGATYNYCVSAYNDCGESGQCCENGTVVPQAVTVTSPNGGENWMVGSGQSITWTSDCITLVDIEYSTDGGSSWITEAVDVSAAGGTYSWTIPDAPSTNCLVRICDASDGSPCDQSNAVFTISTDVVEAVTVTAPNGGEVWCVGSAENITWTSTDIDTVKIEYSTNNGSDWTTEAEKVPAASGSYSWTVPDAPSENCLVRICDAEDGDPCDQSNAVFTILGPPADPSACAASDDLCDKVSFTWTDNSGDETGFYIYRDAAKFDSVGANVTSYDDLTASPGMTYNYCVSAYNDCGESGQCCDNGTRQAPPDAPSDCVATDDLCDRVQFTWTDNSGDETRFYIYRDAAKLDSVGADVTSYDDLTATPGQTYSYCVSAYKDCGESSQCCDDGMVTDVPADPTGCLASDDDCDKVAFCWADLSDNEIGFYIYRDGAKIDSVGADVVCYDDFSAVSEVTYEYCVTAYNECGESGRCCDNGSRSTESITVTSPNGGESWRVGSTEDIQWICSCIDSVMLEYSTDAGASWIAIDSGIACGSETYSWTIPDTPSEDCLVRISDDSDDTPADTSDLVFTIYRPGEMVYVDFDIKPGSCPNPLNTKSNGVLPVAILGTDEFDVDDIDPATVMLEGVSPLRWNWSDVSTPVTDPTDTCDCTTRGGDGYTDMTLKFDKQDIVDALEAQMPFADREVRILTITGMTYAGVPIEGTDCVVILYKGPNRSSAGNLAGYNLGKNYPNPFNPETYISFTLPEGARASLTIYNVLGKAIRVLVDREMTAGTHTLRWDGTDESGTPVSSGIYFYRLKAGAFDHTMRMVLMK